MSVVTPLFRREVLESRNAAAYGTVLLDQNRARRWLCVLFTSIALALVLFLGCASYARTAAVGGVVLPEDVRTVAPAVLCHRLLVDIDRRLRGTSPDEIVAGILRTVPVPLAHTG